MGGQSYYLWVYSNLTPGVYWTYSQDVTDPNPDDLDDPLTLFTPSAQGGPALVSTACWVTESTGTKIRGVLYGGTNDINYAMYNAIYADWLQRKVVFDNGLGVNTSTLSHGPKVGILPRTSGGATQSGTFKLYEEDGTTLEYTSPAVTILDGDVWNVLF